MKFGITSIYPHEWDKITVKEDDREFLVRGFRPDSLMEAARAASLVAEVASDQGLENQVQISVDSEMLRIFIHFAGVGYIVEAHCQLAKAIDDGLGISGA